ncbi:8-amino-7-oxononanoate synthase [Agarivorans sp. DSG3-1]|uniref:8-amino-7-oxononanoate synthase n=1 Tax=Agarivorans sp. DSG3-1 TaxID=3342249 RepID=UPI00398E5879
MAFEFIKEQLVSRKQQQLLRARRCQSSAQGRVIDIASERLLNFSSNDYLGLSHHPKVIDAWKKGAEKYGVGSGGSPLVTGFQTPHYALEQQLCEWQGRAGALLFNSGFSANQAVIKSLLKKGDLLVQDKLNHASLLEAGMLCEAQQKRFAHNDMDQLNHRLSSQENNKLVVTEGVFSMDGDLSPLKEISSLCKHHNAWLMVDDAHGVGCLSDQGRGSISEASLRAEAAQIHMLTFGKALGVSGAAVLCDEELKDYLVNFSKSYVYSTAMPAAQACAVSAAIEVVRTEPEFQAKLKNNIGLFKRLAEQLGLTLANSSTAIQPILLGSSEKALAISQQLQEKGFFVSAIRPPTVPKNTARLRITLSSHHSTQDISDLLTVLVDLLSGEK